MEGELAGRMRAGRKGREGGGKGGGGVRAMRGRCFFVWVLNGSSRLVWGREWRGFQDLR